MSLLPSRKLLLLNHTNVTTTTHINSVDSITSSSSSSSSAPILVEQTGRGGDRDVHDEGNSYPPPCCFNSFRLNPPFDSAMALTVLVLLTALFFMGFFSIYVRRFADENSVDPTRNRRRRNTAAAAPAARLPPGKKGGRGVDPAVIESLPAYFYAGRDLEQGEGEAQECAICLGEFEKRERVKSIPYCGHVFHATCLDTWLSSHVTCPLCRTAELFPSAVPEKNKEETTKTTTTIECDTRRRQVEEGERDTCEEVGTRRVRRTSSWSWDGERVRLHRSLSF